MSTNEQARFTPKQIAADLGISPKALRRFMRMQADAAVKNGNEPGVARVGQGNRYDLNAFEAEAIKSVWRAAHKQS